VDREVRIRFHGEHAPLGPHGDEARALAFPDGEFANEIEYDGRRWGFHHTDLLQGPSDNEPTVEQLVYTEGKPRKP